MVTVGCFFIAFFIKRHKCSCFEKRNHYLRSPWNWDQINVKLGTKLVIY